MLLLEDGVEVGELELVDVEAGVKLAEDLFFEVVDGGEVFFELAEECGVGAVLAVGGALGR